VLDVVQDARDTLKNKTIMVPALTEHVVLVGQADKTILIKCIGFHARRREEEDLIQASEKSDSLSL
jgi:hypothetical protein